MIIHLQYLGDHYTVDLNAGLDISIEIDFDKAGPNCFYAPPPQVVAVEAGDFIGDTQRGGPLNFKTITINPHGNGTHTESVGHISSEVVTIQEVLTLSHHIGQLVTIPPVLHPNGDRIITYEQVRDTIQNATDAVIIRTLPNTLDKKCRNYSGTNPPYVEAQALTYLRTSGVQHLLIDLPSVDREHDDGLLAAHKAWWQYPETLDLSRTITEMIYVDNSILDGIYLVDIHTMSLLLDASPSKVMLYPMSLD